MAKHKGARDKGRHDTGKPASEQLYGAHAVLAALANPRRIHNQLWATRNAAKRFADEIAASGVELREAEPRQLERMLPRDAVHQGMLLETSALPVSELDDVIGGSPLVMLDQVNDPHNVGAIWRSCAAFGVKALISQRHHSPAPSPLIAKAASGAVDHVPAVQVTNIARCLSTLGEYGYQRVGLDGAAATCLSEVPWHDKLVLVLGAEGSGLRRLTRERCDCLARIALPGPISSLNVSNAAAIALHALCQKSD